MNVEGGMDGPGFLDPIPEDVSVVATSQHAANLSTVSAVASSDSGDMAAPTASKKRKGRRIRSNDPSSMLGTTAEAEDTHSDANASLGGANENSLEMPFAMPPKSDDPKAAFWSPTCKKWSLIVTVLAAMVGIGMFVILYRLPQATTASASFDSTQVPTEAPNFSPFTVSYSTGSPPAYSEEEVMILDNFFLQVPGTNNENMFDLGTPEGKGRDWMINSDTAMDITDELRVKQRYAMCVFYFATNGEFWTKNSNWLDPNQPECDWHGISCNNGNNAIRSINLGENNATGTLPDEITYLRNLLSLNISHSKISGTIPQEMFNLLDRLDSLDLKNNQLTGTIPERTILTTNPGLRFIDVGLNQLTGTFPLFRKIESVNFEKNSLTSINGRYSTTRSMRRFKGFHNALAGPLPTTWNSPNLIELDLGYNFLTGTIPNDLWNLPSLKTLWLDHCNLTGPLPESSEGTMMHRLWLDSNSLTGTIPVMFGWNWTKLYSVKLQENSLTGSISMEQCDRWKRLGPSGVSMGPIDVSMTESLPSKMDPSKIDKDRRSTWTFDVDCTIDCACCTNTECASSAPANLGGRR